MENIVGEKFIPRNEDESREASPPIILIINKSVKEIFKIFKIVNQ